MDSATWQGTTLGAFVGRGLNENHGWIREYYGLREALPTMKHLTRRRPRLIPHLGDRKGDMVSELGFRLVADRLLTRLVSRW